MSENIISTEKERGHGVQITHTVRFDYEYVFLAVCVCVQEKIKQDRHKASDIHVRTLLGRHKVSRLKTDHRGLSSN